MTVSRIENTFFCEHKTQCKHQGHVLLQGLSWGRIEDSSMSWRIMHDSHCGGQLVQMRVEFSDKEPGDE